MPRFSDTSLSHFLEISYHHVGLKVGRCSFWLRDVVVAPNKHTGKLSYYGVQAYSRPRHLT
jgi:hypothetical protein